MRAAGGRTFHLYAISVPRDSWVIGAGLGSHFLRIESYEGEPSWGFHGPRPRRRGG